jgi:hypothetical protein
MTKSAELHPLLQGIDINDYNIESIDDEIRVDQLSVDLLRRLYQHLTRHEGIPPEQAGKSCHGVDYFLREFIIGERQENLFEISPIRIRQFAGHWYIVRTPEPNLEELSSILAGTAEFYQYLASQGLIPDAVAGEIASHCKDLDYYQQRIDAFWAIQSDAFNSWRLACPL